jgi:hypothetical protein
VLDEALIGVVALKAVEHYARVLRRLVQKRKREYIASFGWDAQCRELSLTIRESLARVRRGDDFALKTFLQALHEKETLLMKIDGDENVWALRALSAALSKLATKAGKAQDALLSQPNGRYRGDWTGLSPLGLTVLTSLPHSIRQTFFPFGMGRKIKLHVSELKKLIRQELPALNLQLSDRELVETWKRIKQRFPEFQPIFFVY